MLLTVDDAQAEANSRVAAIRLTLHTLRSMENWREGFGELDFESAMIIIAVVAIAAERLTRIPIDESYRGLDKPLPPELLGSCNVSSIAAATGLNRETARRKVNELLAAGLLIRFGRGRFGFADGFAQSAPIQNLIRRQIEVFARVANDLLRDGVFKIV